MRAREQVLLAALLVAAGACAKPAETEAPPLAPTAAWIEAALIGEPSPCNADGQCASGVCRFDACVGALAADQYWLQELVGRRIGERVAAAPETASLVVAAVQGALQREKGSAVVQARAAFVLSFVPGADTTAALAGWLADPSERVRRQAALALAARGDGRGRDLVVQELVTGDVPRRAEAARALGGLKGERVTDALTAALEDEDRHVRREAVLSLTRGGDPRALRPLVRALEELSGPERFVVLQALRAISGRKLGLDPAAWQGVLDAPSGS